MMDAYTMKHLQSWLQTAARDEIEREPMQVMILRAIAADPALGDGSRPWSEVFDAAGGWAVLAASTN
jgi:hypothetical protein